MWETHTNMEKKIVDYILISHDNYVRFQDIVKKHLADGWSLYGNMTVTFGSVGYAGYFFREMVKYEE